MISTYNDGAIKEETTKNICMTFVRANHAIDEQHSIYTLFENEFLNNLLISLLVFLYKGVLGILFHKANLVFGFGFWMPLSSSMINHYKSSK
jgi:hypothetical protein